MDRFLKSTLCVLLGTLVLLTGMYAIAALLTPDPPSSGDFIRLLFLLPTLWVPGMLLSSWPVSIPFILGLGALFAGIRRVDPPSGNAKPAGKPATAPGSATAKQSDGTGVVDETPDDNPSH